MDDLSDYSSLSIAAQKAFLKSLSIQLVGNEVQKSRVLHDPIFLSALLKSVSLSDRLLCSHALIVLNLLLCLPSLSAPILGSYGALSVLLKTVISQANLELDIDALKSISWNLRAFKILLEHANLGFNLSGEMVAALSRLLEYSPPPSTDPVLYLEQNETYSTCISAVYSFILTFRLSEPVMMKLYPLLLNKFLEETTFLLPLLAPGPVQKRSCEDLFYDLLEIERENSISLQQYEDFRNAKHSDMLPMKAPVDVTSIPVYLPALLCALAASMPTNTIPLPDFPDSVYFVLTGLVNSQNVDLQIGAINVLQKYALSHIPDPSLYHTICKYLPYLVILFQKETHLGEAIRLHSPLSLLVELSELSNNDSVWGLRSQLQNALLRHGVIHRVFEKVQTVVNQKLLRSFDRAQGDLGKDDKKSSMKHKDLFFSNCQNYKDIDESNLLFRYASIDVLGYLAACFAIFNCFLFSYEDLSYRLNILPNILTTRSDSTELLSLASSSNATTSHANNVNLIFVNTLALTLKVGHRLEKALLSGKSDLEILTYLHKNAENVCLVNKLAQTVTIFVKYFLGDVRLLRSLLTSSFNCELVFDLLVRIGELKVAEMASYLRQPMEVDLNLFAEKVNSTLSSITVNSAVNSFKYTYRLLELIATTKRVSSLLLANLVLEFSPAKKYSLKTNLEGENILANALNRAICADYGSEHDIHESKGTHTEGSFVNFVLHGSFLNLTDTTIDTKNEVTFELASAGSSFKFDSGVDLHELEAFPFEKDRVLLRVFRKSSVDFQRVFEFKLAAVGVIYNLLYDASEEVKTDLGLSRMPIRLLSQALLVDTHFTDKLVMTDGPYSDSYTLRHDICQLKAQVFGIFYNLLTDLPLIVHTLNMVSSGRLSESYHIIKDREEFFCNIILKHVTLQNVIMEPKLVKIALKCAVNFISANESTRNTAVGCSPFLEMVKLLLDLKLPESAQHHDLSSFELSVLVRLAQINCDLLGLEGSAREEFTSQLKRQYIELFESGNAEYSEFSGIKVACVWVVTNLIWDLTKLESQNSGVSLTSYRDSSMWTVVDRYEKLLDLGIRGSLLRCQESLIYETSNRALVALTHLNTIKQQLEKMGVVS